MTTDVQREPTLAETQGFTGELARKALELAGDELGRGELEGARDILEGLAIANPYDPGTWAMLAFLERRRGRLLAARVCAETAFRLCPTDPQVRLARAEVLLCKDETRAEGAAELTDLVRGPEPAASRARALLTALGVGL